MEQTPSSPGRSPELPSVSPPSNGEKVADASNPEIDTGGSAERQERSAAEAAPVSGQAATPPPSTIALPTPPLPTTNVADDTTQPALNAPTVANDDDLNEKEWVDKAKKVLAETKDDPYRREKEVTRLQEDYLMKRYGRELGSIQ